MTETGFGRRRDSLAGVPDPRSAVPVQSRPPRSPWAWIGLAGIVVLALICLDALFAGTSLITPINPDLLLGTRLIGAVCGAVLGVMVVLKPHKPMGIAMKMLMVSFMPLLLGFVGGQVGYRIADWYEFGLSTAKFGPARYPVKYASPSTKAYSRHSFEIDPFGTKDMVKIPVPADQFDAVWLHASDQCLTVMQRKSPSGAVEVRTDGVFNLSEPEQVDLTSCPEALAD
jgi:hypothetical protein